MCDVKPSLWLQEELDERFLFYLVLDGDGVLHPGGLLQCLLILQFFLSLLHLLFVFPLHGGHAM